MKSRPLALLSGCSTLALGYWLSESSRDAREIWLTIGAWVLGFWFASNLLGDPRATAGNDAADDAYEDEYEDEEGEWEEER